MEEEVVETTEVPDDMGIDIYDYVLLGVPSALILIAAVAFFFRKCHIKIGKVEVDFEGKD